jgi:hypothetical protein
MSEGRGSATLDMAWRRVLRVVVPLRQDALLEEDAVAGTRRAGLRR